MIGWRLLVILSAGWALWVESAKPRSAEDLQRRLIAIHGDAALYKTDPRYQKKTGGGGQWTPPSTGSATTTSSGLGTALIPETTSAPPLFFTTNPPPFKFLPTMATENRKIVSECILKSNAMVLDFEQRLMEHLNSKLSLFSTKLSHIHETIETLSENVVGHINYTYAIEDKKDALLQIILESTTNTENIFGPSLSQNSIEAATTKAVTEAPHLPSTETASSSTTPSTSGMTTPMLWPPDVVMPMTPSSRPPRIVKRSILEEMAQRRKQPPSSSTTDAPRTTTTTTTTTTSDWSDDPDIIDTGDDSSDAGMMGDMASDQLPGSQIICADGRRCDSYAVPPVRHRCRVWLGCEPPCESCDSEWLPTSRASCQVYSCSSPPPPTPPPPPPPSPPSSEWSAGAIIGTTFGVTLLALALSLCIWFAYDLCTTPIGEILLRVHKYRQQEREEEEAATGIATESAEEAMEESVEIEADLEARLLDANPHGPIVRSPLARAAARSLLTAPPKATTH